MSRKLLTFLGFAAVSMMMIEPAFAAGSGGLPWEGPLQQIQQSITGPVAMAVSLIAVAAAASTLILAGGEISEFSRRMCFIVLAAATLLGAAQIVALFPASGASIGISEETQRPVRPEPANA